MPSSTKMGFTNQSYLMGKGNIPGNTTTNYDPENTKVQTQEESQAPPQPFYGKSQMDNPSSIDNKKNVAY